MHVLRAFSGSKKKKEDGESGPTIDERIAACQKSLDVKAAEITVRFEKQLGELSKQLQDSVAGEDKRLETLLQKCNKFAEEATTRQAQMQAKELQDLQQAIDNQLGVAVGRLDAVEPQLMAFRKELDHVQLSAARDTQELREESQATMESTNKLLEHQFSEVEARCMAAVGEEATKSGVLRRDIEKAMGRCDELQAAVNGLQAEQEAFKANTEKAEASLALGQRELERKMDQRLGDLEDGLRGEAQRNFAAAEERRGLEMVELSEDMRVSCEAIARASYLAENAHTRSMTWRMRGFHKRLAALLASNEDACLESPPFCLSTLPQMRLELQVGGRDAAGAMDVPVPFAGVPVPVPGSMTLRLWAPAGTQLAFRVTVGEGASAVCRRFEQTFCQETSAGLPDRMGRCCFPMQNFCYLDNVWERSNDSLLIVFDLLEFSSSAPIDASDSAASVMEVARRRSSVNNMTCRPAALGAAGAGPAVGEAFPAAGGAADSPGDTRPASSGTHVVSVAGSDQRPSSRGSEGDAGGRDCLSFARSGTAELLLQERMRNDLQAVRNRSVRRVEWKVDGCQRILDVCKTGDSLDSPPFCAAGLDRIVFHFYPKGYDTSAGTGTLSPSALYISGPIRTLVRGTLWVGSTQRQLEHRFRGKGDTGGRSKFGPLETQFDCNDSIVIALDISEVEIDLPEVGGSLLLREAPQVPLGTEKLGPKVPITPSPLVNSRGILKMKREDPSKTEELVKCVSLPTLNARQMSLSMLKGITSGRKGAAFS